ncbi:hypothetical protein FIBSPDRAFT_961318 [Athelia psychrophila]|uniref:Ribonuclease H1 N-terminal domain-containing protein n=1 Tax=Athelia psychrophila TaxID=1759441 RepID=A0A166BBV6_9AGAM|nr:hypothetical protein FIBSPDRAFT_961318 [Fibularhizoctonia sp. CBS 109695]
MNTQSQQDLSCAQLAEDPTTQAAAVSPSITVAHAAVVDPPVDEQTSTESEMPLAPAGRFYAVIRGRNRAYMIHTYQHNIFGVNNALGKSFSLRSSAEAFLQANITAGNTEEITDSPALLFATSPSPNSTSLLDRVAMPVIPSGTQIVEDGRAFLVLRGQAPGIYHTWDDCYRMIKDHKYPYYLSYESWEAALTAYRGAMAENLIHFL